MYKTIANYPRRLGDMQIFVLEKHTYICIQYFVPIFDLDPELACFDHAPVHLICASSFVC